MSMSGMKWSFAKCPKCIEYLSKLLGSGWIMWFLISNTVIILSLEKSFFWLIQLIIEEIIDTWFLERGILMNRDERICYDIKFPMRRIRNTLKAMSFYARNDEIFKLLCVIEGSDCYDDFDWSLLNSVSIIWNKLSSDCLRGIQNLNKPKD